MSSATGVADLLDQILLQLLDRKLVSKQQTASIYALAHTALCTQSSRPGQLCRRVHCALLVSLVSGLDFLEAQYEQGQNALALVVVWPRPCLPCQAVFVLTDATPRRPDWCWVTLLPLT